MRKQIISLLIFVAIVVLGSFVLGLIGSLIHGVEWLERPLSNFDFVLLITFMVALNAMHDYEEH